MDEASGKAAKRPDNPDYDGGYHGLFAHPEMVADLLQTFVPEDFIGELDPSRMERVNVKVQAEGLQKRRGDIVWKIPLRIGGDRFVLVFLEFQSTVDPWMAVRVMAYVALIYQQLIKEKKLTRSDGLPPILPIVLYNGEAAWSAAVDAAGLIPLSPTSDLWAWQPQLSHYLVDVLAWAPEKLRGLRRLTALLFRIEQCQGPDQLEEIMDELLLTLPGDVQKSLRRAFAVFIGEILKDKGFDIEPRQLDDLLEVKTMLANQIDSWKERIEEETGLKLLITLLAERLGRDLTEDESRQLQRHMKAIEHNSIVRIALERTPSQLEKWLERDELP